MTLLENRSAVLLSVLALTLTLVACDGKAKDTHPDQVGDQAPGGLQAHAGVSGAPGPGLARQAALQRRALFAGRQKTWRNSPKHRGCCFLPTATMPPPRPTPRFWSQPSEFKAAQDHYTAAVRELVKAAEGGQVDAVKSAVNAVQKSCKACHTQFRSAR